MKIFIFLIFCGIFGVFSDDRKCSEATSKKIFCYYQSSSALNSSFNENFYNYPPPCTHIIFAFAGLDINGKIVLSQNHQIETQIEKEIFNLIKLKEKRECLKILISVGGYDEGSEKFSSLVETDDSIEKFSNNVLKFLIFYGFDGIDIHWMYPTMRGGIPEDRLNFVKLLKVLKQKLNKRNKLVVAALGAKSSLISSAYEPIKNICDTLDYALFMTYDYNDRHKTSINAPLLQDNEVQHKETINENIQKLLAEGCDEKKIILGISTYGKVYKLKYAFENFLGANANEMNDFHENKIDGGNVEYEKICNALNNNVSIFNNHKHTMWTIQKLTNSHSKYAFHDRFWISYDDHETVDIKTLYALSKNLNGLMFFTINGDGNCVLNFPLINSAHKIIKEYEKHCHNLSSQICVKKLAKNHEIQINF
ncbi:hypothetical protein PVAND_015814 [Polypedilum vanderplanki]|uniref:GH18 domain-containing protein n=1 Tax=Polypedilum vanderplanki TaxID=319348 RepID=A0A9J6BDM4_POLVA|nr:hypothetical protein PVAND_015814 [Polypedilum vanderplanki]